MPERGGLEALHAELVRLEQGKNNRKDVGEYLSEKSYVLREDFLRESDRARELEGVSKSFLAESNDQQNLVEAQRLAREAELKVAIFSNLEQRLGGKLEISDEEFELLMKVVERRVAGEAERKTEGKLSESLSSEIEEEWLLQCLERRKC
jgi:hypothetical protein